MSFEEKEKKVKSSCKVAAVKNQAGECGWLSVAQKWKQGRNNRQGLQGEKQSQRKTQNKP